MNQRRSELAPAARGEESTATPRGSVLSGAHLDRLLAAPSVGAETASSPNRPAIHGIWLGAAAGVVIWLLLGALLFLH